MRTIYLANASATMLAGAAIALALLDRPRLAGVAVAIATLVCIWSLERLRAVLRRMQRKRIDPETAMATAMQEISERTVAEFVGVLFGGARG